MGRVGKGTTTTILMYTVDKCKNKGIVDLLLALYNSYNNIQLSYAVYL